jgi:hypothetical protein
MPGGGGMRSKRKTFPHPDGHFLHMAAWQEAREERGLIFSDAILPSEIPRRSSFSGWMSSERDHWSILFQNHPTKYKKRNE